MQARKAPAYKLVPPDKFSARWKRAKAAFFAEAGRKKPKVSKELTLFGLKLAKYKGSSGVEKQLKVFEQNLPGAYTNPAKRKKMQDAQGIANRLGDEFSRLMDATVASAPEGVDKAKLASAVDKLGLEIREIALGMAREVNKLKNTLGESKTFSVMANKLAKTVRQLLGDTMVWIDELRENPDVAEFNFEIGAKARAITQQAGNVNKLTDMGYEFAFGEPTEEFAGLKPWANDRRKVDDDADDEALLAELDEFERAVQAMATWAGHI